MSKRYYPYWGKNHREMNKREKISWVITSIVFVFMFIFYFIHGFFINCVFNWPIRWDVGTCWSEQIEPAKNKAVESASQFIP